MPKKVPTIPCGGTDAISTAAGTGWACMNFCTTIPPIECPTSTGGESSSAATCSRSAT